MLDIIVDAVVDSVKLLPFLFLTYLVMEYIEDHAGGKTEQAIQKSGKFGPIIGGILGVIPQCGFSTAAASLYAGRVVTLGTLIAIFLSTSDEMLPILIGELAKNSTEVSASGTAITVAVVLRILCLKAAVGIIAGILIDLVVKKKQSEQEHLHIHDLCEHDHCHCERGILFSALRHTMQIFLFIFLMTLGLNLLIHEVGEDTIANIVLNRPVLGELLAGLVGLIPNCAASVALTQLYVSGTMSGGAMMSGLFVSAGVGVLVLCRTNHHPVENIKIIALLYTIGVLAGMLVGVLGLL